MELGNHLKKVSIDNLTLLGDQTEKFERLVNDPLFDFIKGKQYASFPYRNSFPCMDGSIFQFSDRLENQALRYEFNPNNVGSDQHLNAVNKIINTMKYVKVSRLDIAMDFVGVDLSEYEFMDTASRKTNEWRNGSRKLETYYIGSPSSDLRIRIYDKGVEMGLEEQREPWWRVEAQMRGKVLEGVDYRSARLLNPFEGITIRQHEIDNDLSIQTQAMLYLLQNNPNKWSELNRHTRTKYKKILADQHISKEIAVRDLFEDHRYEITKQIKEWIEPSLINNVIRVS